MRESKAKEALINKIKTINNLEEPFWIKKAEATAYLHKKRQEEYGAATRGHYSEKWGVPETSKELNENIATTAMHLKLEKALKKHPELRKVKSCYAAYNMLQELERKDEYKPAK